MAAPAPAYLTTEQFAAALHMTPAALLVLRSRGKAPRAIKPGKRLLWPVSEIEAWERKRLA